MKANKLFRLLALLCALTLVLCAVACGSSENPAADPTPDDNTPPAPETLTYTVNLVDGNGAHMKNVIVKIMKGDEQIAMKVYNGAPVTFEAEAGTYTVEMDLTQLEQAYSYDASLCTLTAEAPSTTIRLYMQTAPYDGTLFVGNPISMDYPAQHIGVGSYRLTLTPNDYTFLVFRPEVAAIYTITYECSSELAISYHGGTFFVQGNDLAPDSDNFDEFGNGLSFSVYESNLGGDMVLAIRGSAESCVLHVKNAGDPGTRLEDLPWAPYTENPSNVAQHLQIAADAAANGTWNTVDLADMSLTAVYNDADGYYHLGGVDGPILYIDLTTDTTFIPSVQIICANQRMGLYIYDGEGNVTEKRSFNELFHQYGMPTDDTSPADGPIRVPLTQKLAEAIQAFGEKSEWWKIGSEKNIFNNAGMSLYNQAYAWLLYCGYYA